MSYDCRILADSVASSVRLTTMQVTFPRIVLAEMNTHRMLSRNSASSRAIPVEKNIERVLADPFIPAAFGANRRGMQSTEALPDDHQRAAKLHWLLALEDAVKHARSLVELDVHKQWANRLLEPFAWHTAIVTATEWDNFFSLRCNAMAAPEIRTIAEMMREAMQESQPEPLELGEWHLPFVREGEVLPGAVTNRVATTEERVKLSVARCARVSYLTHDGKCDFNADLALYDRLLTSGHMSPFEHAAKVMEPGTDYTLGLGPASFVGNFRAPWIQHRKQIDGEAIFTGTT